MGQGMSCNFEDAVNTVEQVQRDGLVSVISESLEENPIDAKLIKAGTPQQTNLAWRNYEDEFKDGKMSQGLRRTMMGSIVFASETIGKDEDDDSILDNRFELTEDIEIHCRAYWPRAVRNYALGIKPDGQPAYGPEFMTYCMNVSGRNTVEFIAYYYINGEKIVEPKAVDGSFWHHSDRGQQISRYQQKQGYVLDKNRPDWYAYTQTRRWLVLGGKPDDSEDGDSVIRLGREVAKLPKGDHKIRIEYCFRLLPGAENKGKFPAQPTPISFPIAAGEFTLVVNHDSEKIQKKLQEANRLPERTTSLSAIECDRIEDALWRLFKNSNDQWGGNGTKPEQPIHIVVVGEWEQINEGTKKAPIYKWTIPVKVVSKRRKALGWPKDHYAAITCGAVTPNFQKQANFVYISVPMGSEADIPSEFIPEELKKSSSRKKTEQARKDRLKAEHKEEEKEKEKEEHEREHEHEHHEHADEHHEQEDHKSDKSDSSDSSDEDK